MKKSLLALALLATSSLASAATVYDKDGNTLSIVGRVQSVFYNGAYNKAGEKDASLINSARFGLAGQTKVNNYINVLAFAEWDAADGQDKSFGNKTLAREQYVGVSFNEYGRVIAGRTWDNTKQVLILTDMFESLDLQNDTAINIDRRSGVVRYDLNNSNFALSVTAQLPSDNQKVYAKMRDVESGYGATLGYTFNNVGFGPLTAKAGYSYLKGQNDDSAVGDKRFEKADNVVVGLGWGNPREGLYLGTLYYYQNTKFKNQGKTNEVREGFDVVGGYTFDNGIALYTGYNYQQFEDKFVASNNKESLRKIPVQVKYDPAPNFRVWAEAEFDVGSDVQNKDKKNTEYTVGARYTF